ncbi:MAG TPA: class I adenylate-forming enzyme family protein [Vicinamibacterales bacterium]|nr:class I adenylate-forming enzyme family protein [Vicinamibacterales bacterium]
MIAVREPHTTSDLSRLDEAWAAPETFAIVPDKSPIDGDALVSAAQLLPVELRHDHFIMMTSGSTGEPKLVIGNRERAAALARVLHARQDSEAVRETIAMLPLSYTFAFVNQWVWARVLERRFVQTGGLANASTLRAALTSARNAMVCLVGAQVPLLLDAFPDDAFPGVIRIHFAGGRFPQERLGDVSRLFPCADVFNNYGCAEAMPRLTIRRASDAGVAEHVGWPLPGVELRCDAADAMFFRSAFGAVGVIEGGVFRSISSEDWVATGDLGQQSADGAWRLLGRAGDVFKRHGEKVSPLVLLEAATSAWRGGLACYRDVDAFGEPGCVLTLSPPPDADSVRRLLGAVRRHLRRAQWPLRIECVDTMPLLPSGKPDVQAIGSAPSRRVLWKQYL